MGQIPTDTRHNLDISGVLAVIKMYVELQSQYLLQNVRSLLDHPLCERIPVPQPPRFYPCPCRRENFKAMRGLDIWEFCLALCLQNLWSIWLKKLSTFC